MLLGICWKVTGGMKIIVGLNWEIQQYWIDSTTEQHPGIYIHFNALYTYSHVQAHAPVPSWTPQQLTPWDHYMCPSHAHHYIHPPLGPTLQLFPLSRLNI